MKTTTLQTAKKELSTLTVEQILDGKNLPDNFDRLSRREQKEIIAGMLIRLSKQALDCMTFGQRGKEAARKLSAEIKASPAAIKLAALKKDMRRNELTIRALTERFYAIRELAVALGINEKTLSNIKLIENE